MSLNSLSLYQNVEPGTAQRGWHPYNGGLRSWPAAASNARCGRFEFSEYHSARVVKFQPAELESDCEFSTACRALHAGLLPSRLHPRSLPVYKRMTNLGRVHPF